MPSYGISPRSHCEAPMGQGASWMPHCIRFHPFGLNSLTQIGNASRFCKHGRHTGTRRGCAGAPRLPQAPRARVQPPQGASPTSAVIYAGGWKRHRGLYFSMERYPIKPKGYSHHQPISLIKSCKTPSSEHAINPPHTMCPQRCLQNTTDAAEGFVSPIPPSPGIKSCD